MPYEVIADVAISLLHATDVFKTDDGKVVGYDHISHIRTPGEVVPDDEVSPVVKEAYEDDDDHVTSLIKYVEKAEDEESVEKPATKRGRPAAKKESTENE